MLPVTQQRTPLHPFLSFMRLSPCSFLCTNDINAVRIVFKESALGNEGEAFCAWFPAFLTLPACLTSCHLPPARGTLNAPCNAGLPVTHCSVFVYLKMTIVPLFFKGIFFGYQVPG